MKVLFLCTGNSCRSQMAEGWVTHLLSGEIEARSAGVDPGQLDPRAVAVMAEAGVDISQQRSKGVSELLTIPFDLVVTVCDHARESCPVFPGPVEMVHQAFDDPPHLTRDISDENDRLEIYRRVRDEIRAFVETLPDSLPKNEACT
jgi:arsenate reductase